jgi:hypothetical protein
VSHFVWTSLRLSLPDILTTRVHSFRSRRSGYAFATSQQGCGTCTSVGSSISTLNRRCATGPA